MTTQAVAFIIALAGIGLVALGFIFVIGNTRKPADDGQMRKPVLTRGRLQAGLFAVLLVIFAGGSWATLRSFPIPPQHGAVDAEQVVEVVGHMWHWEITPSTLTAGETVAFEVTSADVNHGFAIYSPGGRVLTQTQAMPGYTNRLIYTFHEPGTYKVQCLEYCGLGHVPMQAAIHVVSAGGE